MVSQIGIHASVDALFPPSVLRDALSTVGPTIQIVESESDLEGCDAVVTFSYDESFLDANLTWIHSIQSGVDRFPFEQLEQRDIALTSSAGIHGDSVGETVAGYMLQFARRLHIHRDNEHRREWQYPAWDAAFTLPNESLCVIGLGTLGRGIAARAAALGLTVTGVKRTPVPVDHVTQIYTPDELMKAIADVRFVAVAVPLTDQTEGLIGADELATMRDDAYLLNVSRGGVVDDEALLAALRADDLAGAALDVFETEPLPDESPFWTRQNVIVTPHAAAANREYYQRVAALVRENVRRLEANETLANRVV